MQKLKQNGILFVDKNIVPNNIDKTITTIKRACKTCQVVGLIPIVGKRLENYPFSLNSIIQCLLRIMKRDSNYVLNSESEFLGSMGVFFMFLKMFRRVEFDE